MRPIKPLLSAAVAIALVATAVLVAAPGAYARALGVAALVSGSALPSGPAKAPPKSGLTTTATRPLAKATVAVAFGDASLTLSWTAVTGAQSYRVEYSTNSAMTAPSELTVGGALSAMVQGLHNGTTYYARVVAVASKAAANSTSATVRATPDDGYPTLLSVSAVPAGPNQIRVSWTGQGRATKVGVIAGSEGSLTQLPFNSGWYPATTTSIVLTVPTALRAQLGTGSGNPIFVKVATYNSLTAGNAFSTTKDVAADYRLSLAGTYAWAGASTPTGATIRVAELNVNSEAASSTVPGYTWANRRTKVAASILLPAPDLVATEELTTADAGLNNSTTQVQDLTTLLKPSGYAITTVSTPAGSNVTKGAHLFYKTSRLTLLAGADVSPKTDLGVSWPSELTDRYFSWAEFRITSTGAVFFAAAVHLPADAGSTSYSALRVSEITAINTYLSKLAGSNPVVIMGDFNSSFAQIPRGPDTTLTGLGYYDASNTASRTNVHFSTATITNQIDNLSAPGYPNTAYAYQYAAPRIDYIFTKNAPGSFQYTNQLVFTSGSTFNKNYQGSDHNLQWADLGIP